MKCFNLWFPSFKISCLKFIVICSMKRIVSVMPLAYWSWLAFTPKDWKPQSWTTKCYSSWFAHKLRQSPVRTQSHTLNLFFLFFIFLNKTGQRGGFLFIFIYLFIYFCLCWFFVSVRGPSPVAASRGHSSSRCAGLSLSRPLPLRSTGSRCAGSVVVAHGPSCSAASGIFLDRGTNPCALHWQEDS